MKFLKKFFKRNQKKEEFEDPTYSNVRREIQIANESMCFQIQKGAPQNNESFKKLVLTQTLINNIILEHTSGKLINTVVRQVQLNREAFMSQDIGLASETIQ